MEAFSLLLAFLVHPLGSPVALSPASHAVLGEDFAHKLAFKFQLHRELRDLRQVTLPLAEILLIVSQWRDLTGCSVP